MEKGWVYLCGAAQEIEAGIITGLLEEQKIPARKVYLGAGEFTRIASGLTSGIEIYVPQEYLTDAKETVAAAENLSFQAGDGVDDLNGQDDQSKVDDAQLELNERVQDAGINQSGGFSRWWLAFFVILTVLVVIFVVRANRLF